MSTGISDPMDAATEAVLGILHKGEMKCPKCGEDCEKGKKCPKCGKLCKGGDTEPEDEEEDEEKKKANADERSAASASKEGEEEEEPAGKSEATVAEEKLEKALTALETLAGVAPGVDRRADLAGKLAAGTLSKSERTELNALLAADEEPLIRSESYNETIGSDPAIQEGYNALPFLERLATMQTGALDEVREVLEKSYAGNARFNKALAQAVGQIGRVAVQQGQLIKSLTDRLNGVEAQPVPRRGVTAQVGLRKSFGAAQGQGGQVDPGSAERAFNQMSMESFREGRGGMSKSGEDIADAWSIYSKFGQLSPGVAAELQTKVSG